MSVLFKARVDLRGLCVILVYMVDSIGFCLNLRGFIYKWDTLSDSALLSVKGVIDY